MKKTIKLLIITLICCVGIVGCSFDSPSSTTNEIINKTYNVTLNVQELQNTLNGVVEKCKGAVLGVNSYDKQFLTQKLTLSSVGSGVVYKGSALLKDGSTVNITDALDIENVKTFQYYLVTNKHVVKEADAVKIYDGDEDVEVDATLKAMDSKVDLAVIYFEYDKFIVPLEFADSDEAKAGDFVISIGHPFGYDYYGSASFGIVSNVKRYLADDTDDDGVNDWDAEYVQHDSAINSGNSGGPLLNIEGKIVGINTMKLADENADCMGFAIPSNVVVSIIEQLQEGTVPTRAKLGITCLEIRGLDKSKKEELGISSDLNSGLYVSEVGTGVCKNAGIKAGDIILKFDDTEIRYSYQIRTCLNRFVMDSGETATLYVLRGEEYITITIVF